MHVLWWKQRVWLSGQMVTPVCKGAHCDVTVVVVDDRADNSSSCNTATCFKLIIVVGTVVAQCWCLW